MLMLEIITKKKIIEQTGKHKRKKKRRKGGEKRWTGRMEGRKDGKADHEGCRLTFEECSKESEMLLRTNLYQWQGSRCYLK